MCQKCLKAIQKYYPHLNDSEQRELLVGATCFPFGSPKMVEEQLAELREKTDGSLRAALKMVEEQLLYVFRDFLK